MCGRAGPTDGQRANRSKPSAERELQQQQEQQQAATEAYLKPIEFSGRSSEPEVRLSHCSEACATLVCSARPALGWRVAWQRFRFRGALSPDAGRDHREHRLATLLLARLGRSAVTSDVQSSRVAAPRLCNGKEA